MKQKTNTNQKEYPEIYADLFYVVSNESALIRRMMSPALEGYVSSEPKALVEEVYQAITPEGTIFEFSSKDFAENTSAIIKDPISEKSYRVIF